MAKDFDYLLSEDYSFTVRGETFRFIDPHPDALRKVAQELQEMVASGNGDLNALDILDFQLMAFLPKSEQERWKELRAREDQPVKQIQVQEIVQWLWEEQTGRPTELLSDSQPGPGSTEATSTPRSSGPRKK